MLKLNRKQDESGLGLTTVIAALVFAVSALVSSSARGESAAYGVAEFLFENGHMVSHGLVQRDPTNSSHFATAGRIWTGVSYHAYVAAYLQSNGAKDTSYNGGGSVSSNHVGKRIIDFNTSDSANLENFCRDVVTDGTNFYAICRSMLDNNWMQTYLVKFDASGDLVTGFGNNGIVNTGIGGNATDGHAYPRALDYDADNGVLIVGGFVGFTNFGGIHRPFFAAFDAADGSQYGTTQKLTAILGTMVDVIYDPGSAAYYGVSNDTSGERNIYVHQFNTTTLAESSSPWGDAIDFSVAGTPAGTDSVPSAMTVLPGGSPDRIVIVGSNRADSSTPPWNCAMVQIEATTGNLSAGFGEVDGTGGNNSTGISLWNQGGLDSPTNDCILNDVVDDVAYADDIIAAGTAYSGINYDFLTISVDTEFGTIRTSHGTSGFAINTLGLSDDVLNEVKLLNDPTTATHVVAAGRSTGDTHYGGVNIKALTSTGVLVFPPTITEVSPSYGPTAGGTSMTITGKGFQNSTLDDVTFGGVSCTSQVAVSDTEITCTTASASAGVVDVIVTVGGETATLADGFEYVPPPTVTSVDPASGPVSGGTQVVVTGTGFRDGAAVDIGGVACPGMLASDTVIQCTTRECTGGCTAGAKLVTVTNTDAQFATLTNGFTYISAPQVVSITPEVGPVTGGTSVTISGNGFIHGPSPTVLIAGIPCTGVSGGASSLTCTTGAAATEGVGDVYVENNDGGVGIKFDAFTYQEAIQVTSVSPAVGPVSGGTEIFIEGSGFYTASGGATLPTVMLDPAGSPASCGSVVYHSDTLISCTTSAHAAATVDVEVTNPDTSSDSVASAFEYRPVPTISNVSPDNGPAAGGTTVTITGTNFVSGALVTIGNKDCAVGTLGAGSITCTTSASAAGTYDVKVMNPDGQSATDNNAYTYYAAPTVTSISNSVTLSNFGRASGGETATIRGTGFITALGATVSIGGTACGSPTVVNNTTITCTIGNHGSEALNVDVVVTNSDTSAQSGTLSGGYSYWDAPTVTNVSPSTGNTDGGTAVTITGTGFKAGAIPKFDGTACTNISVTPGTSITCDTPPHAAGGITVTVTNLDTQVGTWGGTYTYTQAAPSILSVTPSAGPIGETVTITGTSFYTGIICQFGTTNGTNVSGLTSLGNGVSSFTCDAPAGETGTVNVLVRNLDTQTDTAINAFTYQSSPSVARVEPASGSREGGTSVTIYGSNFQAGATVTFTDPSANDTSCTSVSFVNASTLTCTTSASTSNYEGDVDVTVENPDLGTDTLVDGFTYVRPLGITDVFPSGGPVAGGTQITISGDGFKDGAIVRLDPSGTDTLCTETNGSADTSEPAEYVTGAQLKCYTAARTAGTVTLEVTNPNGEVDTYASAFTYRAAPTVTAVSPTSGPTGGGTTVTVTGTGFVSGRTAFFENGNGSSECEIEGSPAPTATSFDCTTTAHLAGVVDVKVVNPDNQEGVLGDGFEYVRTPEIYSITPSRGPSSGGTSVTIAGANFEDGLMVELEVGNLCSNVVVVSSSEITCTTQGHDPGGVDLIVTSDSGLSDTLTNGYVYLAAGQWNAMTNTSRHPAFDAASSVWLPGGTDGSGNLRSAKMVIFGGYNGSVVSYGTAYDPVTNQWSTISTDGDPSPRLLHQGSYIGTQHTSVTNKDLSGTMVIWGGRNLAGVRYADGKVYDPVEDTWVVDIAQTATAPKERSSHSMGVVDVAGDPTLVVWGGVAGNYNSGVWVNTGGTYNFRTQQWTATNFANAPSTRRYHTFTPFAYYNYGDWTTTSDQVAVWGGVQFSPHVAVNNGRVFDVSSNTWAVMTTTGGPSRRARHAATWLPSAPTDPRLIVMGGWREDTGGPDYNDAYLYDPSVDSWSVATVPTGLQTRFGHSVVTTNDTGAIFWGGCFTAGFRSSGYEYYDATDSGALTVLSGAPKARAAHFAHWAAEAGVMIVWGGMGWTGSPGGSIGLFLDGSRYTPR